MSSNDSTAKEQSFLFNVNKIFLVIHLLMLFMFSSLGVDLMAGVSLISICFYFLAFSLTKSEKLSIYVIVWLLRYCFIWYLRWFVSEFNVIFSFFWSMQCFFFFPWIMWSSGRKKRIMLPFCFAVYMLLLWLFFICLMAFTHLYISWILL